MNHPFQETYRAPDFEIRRVRSTVIYDAFTAAVVDATGDDLLLYFDVHLYGGQSIQIATVGVSEAVAQRLKHRFQRNGDRLLKAHPQIESVSLMIEPLDDVEIGAWPAKVQGILGFAPKRLHIELPLETALRSEKSREVYLTLVAELMHDASIKLAKTSRFSP